MLKWVRGDENDIRGENTQLAQGAGGHLAGKNIFSKKYAKPLDNYTGIVYNKAMIKQGAEAPKGDKNGKHGKRKRY